MLHTQQQRRQVSKWLLMDMQREQPPWFPNQQAHHFTRQYLSPMPTRFIDTRWTATKTLRVCSAKFLPGTQLCTCDKVATSTVPYLHQQRQLQLRCIPLSMHIGAHNASTCLVKRIWTSG